MPRKLTQREKDERRHAIILGAANLFRKRGYAYVTVDDIAKALRTSKLSIYSHVRSKEDILYQIHDLVTTALLQKLEEIANTSWSPTRKLAEAIESHIRMVCSEMSPTTVALQQEYALRRMKKKKLIAKRDEYDSIFRAIIKEGIETGEFIDCDPKLISFAIIGSSNYMPHWYSSKGLLTKDEIIIEFVKYLMRGLCVDQTKYNEWLKARVPQEEAK